VRNENKQPAKPTEDRLPPHSLEMEQGVLGCIMLSPADGLAECLNKLKGDGSKAFYDLRHQLIYQVMRQMHEQREPIDLITLQQRLKDRDVLDQVGGIPYLSQLQDAVPSAANLSYYLDIVREKYTLRQWVTLCTEVIGRIYDFEGEVDSLTDQISRDVFQLCEREQTTVEKSFRDVVLQVQEIYLDKFRRGVKHKIGPLTGFNYLDNILPGFGRGQMIVLAARPRTGKSALMMQWVENISLLQKCPTGVISLEMSSESLGAREIFQRAGSDMTKFLNGFMSDADVQKLVSASAQLAKMPVFIDDSERMSIEDFEVRARRLVQRHKLGVLFIDYFQLLYVRNRHKQWSKSDELAECSMRIKALAKELGIPIVVLAQMNREIEKDTHRRPRLSDLKDTGQLEQDADVIMFLWKPNIKSEAWQKRVLDILPRVPVQEDWRLEKTWKKNLAIVICTVEKQREGRSGEDATLVFIKPWTRFVDAYTPKVEEQQALKDAEPEEDQDDNKEEGE
jgi:replicative DNA helicase